MIDNNGYESTASNQSGRTTTKMLSNFYSKIKEPKSAQVRAHLENFYEQEQYLLDKNEGDRQQQAERVHDLMDELAQKFQDIHQESESEMELSGEGIETIVCKNLYQHLFASSPDDERLAEIVKKHQGFIKPEHLEMGEGRVKNDVLKFANATLSQWNSSSNKVPAAKIKCMINFIRIIQGLLNETAEEGHPDGADTLLPMTIYTIIQMTQQQNLNLKSNLEYIRLFRHPDRLDGQEEYYLTNMESAVEFILNISAKDLKIDPLQYQKYLQDIDGISEQVDLLELNQQPLILDLEKIRLEQENLALKSVLNAFIDKIYKHKSIEFEDLSINNLKTINSAAFELLGQVTHIIKSDQKEEEAAALIDL